MKKNLLLVVDADEASLSIYQHPLMLRGGWQKLLTAKNCHDAFAQYEENRNQIGVVIVDLRTFNSLRGVLSLSRFQAQVQKAGALFLTVTDFGPNSPESIKAKKTASFLFNKPIENATLTGLLIRELGL